MLWETGILSYHPQHEQHPWKHTQSNLLSSAVELCLREKKPAKGQWGWSKCGSDLFLWGAHSMTEWADSVLLYLWYLEKYGQPYQQNPSFEYQYMSMIQDPSFHKIPLLFLCVHLTIIFLPPNFLYYLHIFSLFNITFPQQNWDTDFRVVTQLKSYVYPIPLEKCWGPYFGATRIEGISGCIGHTCHDMGNNPCTITVLHNRWYCSIIREQ